MLWRVSDNPLQISNIRPIIYAHPLESLSREDSNEYHKLYFFETICEKKSKELSLYTPLTRPSDPHHINNHFSFCGMFMHHIEPKPAVSYVNKCISSFQPGKQCLINTVTLVPRHLINLLPPNNAARHCVSNDEPLITIL